MSVYRRSYRLVAHYCCSPTTGPVKEGRGFRVHRRLAGRSNGGARELACRGRRASKGRKGDFQPWQSHPAQNRVSLGSRGSCRIPSSLCSPGTGSCAASSGLASASCPGKGEFRPPPRARWGRGEGQAFPPTPRKSLFSAPPLQGGTISRHGGGLYVLCSTWST